MTLGEGLNYIFQKVFIHDPGLFRKMFIQVDCYSKSLNLTLDFLRKSKSSKKKKNVTMTQYIIVCLIHSIIMSISKLLFNSKTNKEQF